MGEPDQQPIIVHVPTNLPFPSKLDMKGNLCTNWKKFQRVWENYEIATGLKDKATGLRTVTLLTCIGSEALQLFDGLSFDREDDRKDIDKVLEKFENYCVGQTNDTYERYMFNKREQEQGESIDTYIAALRSLAKTCKYGTLEDDLIRDRVVMGVRDNNTRKKLLQDRKLDLKKCIDICRSCEKTTLQLKEMSHEEVKFVKKKTATTTAKPKGGNPRKAVTSSSQEVDCRFCGRRHTKKKEMCPAWGQTCINCGRKNHFKVKCTAKRTHKQRNTTVHYLEEEEDDDEEFVLTIGHVNVVNGYSKKIQAKMLIENEEVLFQVDCGSTVNIIPEKLYTRIFKDTKSLESTPMTLVMFNKTETKPLGKRRIRVVTATGKRFNVEFVVVKGDVQAILGAQASQQMRLITVNTSSCVQIGEGQQSVQAIKTNNGLKSKYDEVFKGLGKLPGKLNLEINRDVQPVQIPTRKVPVAVKDKLKTELDRLTQEEIITPVKTPTEWISSMVVVTKPSGNVRLCIDPKPLNKALKRNHYPTPTMDAILPELHKARIFTVADAKDGFWQVELDDESSYLTTFGTPWGRYRWKSSSVELTRLWKG